MSFSLTEKGVMLVNSIVPDGGRSGKADDTSGDVLAGEIVELERRKRLLVDEIAGLSRDRDKVFNDVKGQVMRMLHEFVISFFDEDFAVAFDEYCERYRLKENRVEAYG